MNIASLLQIPSFIVPGHVAAVGHGTTHGTAGPIDVAGLWDRAARVATVVRDHGVRPHERVALVATNSIELLAALYGVAAAGAVAVPLNYKASADEFQHLITDAGARLVVAEPRYVESISTILPADVPLLALDAGDDGWSAHVDRSDPVVEVAEVDPDDLAVLLYTSGTSSTPKGVRLTHGALSGYVMGANDAADGTNDEVMLLAAPLYHVAGLTSVLNSVYVGRTIVVLPQFEPTAWLDAVGTHTVTHAFVVPTMLHRITSSDAFETARLDSLRSVTYGAAPMPLPVILRAIQRFPAAVEFAGAYGQTETTSTVAVLGPEDHRLDGPPAEVERRTRRLRSVGKIVDDVEVRIVDELGQDAPRNAIGEVWLRTARAAAGYWGGADAVSHHDDAGWIHTGDLGMLDDDDYLFLTGRRGDMIIRGGENVAPEEVESTLLRFEALVDIGVVGVPDEDWGERIAAAVVLRPGTSVDELESFAREHLAAFKRPAEYVVVEELPRTSTGKLVRRELVSWIGDPG